MLQFRATAIAHRFQMFTLPSEMSLLGSNNFCGKGNLGRKRPTHSLVSFRCKHHWNYGDFPLGREGCNKIKALPLASVGNNLLENGTVMQAKEYNWMREIRGPLVEIGEEIASPLFLYYWIAMRVLSMQ